MFATLHLLGWLEEDAASHCRWKNSSHRVILGESKIFRFLRTPQPDKVDRLDLGVKDRRGVHCSGNERETLPLAMPSRHNVKTGAMAMPKIVARARHIKERPKAANGVANKPRTVRELQFALLGDLRAGNARETAHVLSIELMCVNGVCHPLTARWTALDRRWSAGIVTSDLSMTTQTPRH